MSKFVTITTLSFCPPDAKTVSDALDQAVQLIDLASNDQPDLIVLPECFTGTNEQCEQSPNKSWSCPETIEGRTVSRIAELAHRHHCYIATPLILERDGKFYNSTVLLDRSGQVAGVYDKYVPTIFEMEEGRNTTPGSAAVTVDTDFGRLGMVICFDLNFEELRLEYLKKEVKLLLFCSMWSGGLRTRTWALLNGCYFVSSLPGAGSVVVNPLGRVLAESGLSHPRIMTRRINLDYKVLHLDYNQVKIAELHKRFGSQIELEIHDPEDRMLLSSTTPELTAEQICSEMGLEPVEDFLARSRAARLKALESGPLPQGPTPW